MLDIAIRQGKPLGAGTSSSTSALIGASSVAQSQANVAALGQLQFADEELAEIDRYAR